jgi:hypothetical protein
MFKLSCPACASEVIFKSKASAFAVCSYCKSTLVRHDLNLEVYGKMSDVIEDLSPLQLWTKGFYDGRAFELVGRVRIAWSEGYWNEWYTVFLDGGEGWLAEAQGFYSLCFNNNQLKPPEREQVMLGTLVEVTPDEGMFEVVDLKEATCIGSEGELPFKAVVGRKSLSVDLSASGGRFACIEYAPEETRFFAGCYLDFDDFKFSNLREIEGWRYGG